MVINREAGSGKREGESGRTIQRDQRRSRTIKIPRFRRSNVPSFRPFPLFSAATVVTVVSVLLPAPRSLAGQDVEVGKELYDKWCSGCHGENGTGDGPAAAFMLPRPRDFSGAVYQVRTTATGELPTDEDLRWVIDKGMHGTAMPGWEDRLSARERDDVLAYIKSFSRFFDGASPEPISMTGAPRQSDEGLAEGREVYRELECNKCHGDAGRGDGPSAPTLTDDWDFPIRPADLTEPWNFNGGGTVEDIHTRLLTGLDGTPMPSSANVIDAEIITEEQLWRVAQYVGSLGPKDPPRVRDVIRARLTSQNLPSNPGDTAWVGVESYYVPLVGQIIVKPRWFIPTVHGIWVQAVHDGERVAVKLTWHDPSMSPDPDWDEYLERVTQTVTDVDGPLAREQGADRVAVQFPLKIDDRDLPYFLAGDTRRPVYMLRWTSSPDRLEEGTAVGLGAFSPYTGAPEVTHSARYQDGEWQLQVTLMLAPTDSTRATTFARGRPIPIGFYVADGSSGEDAVRGAVSAWYAVYLDLPTLPRVYVAPILATLLTAGLGIMIVWRAQQRVRQGT